MPKFGSSARTSNGYILMISKEAMFTEITMFFTGLLLTRTRNCLSKLELTTMSFACLTATLSL
jgi:hypothetical protein